MADVIPMSSYRWRVVKLSTDEFSQLERMTNGIFKTRKQAIQYCLELTGYRQHNELFAVERIER
jgi:hypothetical protein